MVFINPEFVDRDGTQLEEEGCLSVPGFNATVVRPSRVVVRGRDRQWQEQQIEAQGLLARAFQHEMDHLQGMLFFNRMGPAARDLVIRKFKRAQRQRR